MPKLVNVNLALKIPGIGGISGTWEPDESEIRAAWELYVEVVTRTPLGGFSPLSKVRVNVRLSVQHKCHSVMPRWYQILA